MNRASDCNHYKTYYIWIETHEPKAANSVKVRLEVCRHCGKTATRPPAD